MFDFLDRLRAKPEAYRIRLVVLLAGGVTILIAFFWIVTLDFETNEKASRDRSLPSPFSTIGDKFSDVLEGGAKQINDLQGRFNEGLPEAAPEQEELLKR